MNTEKITERLKLLETERDNIKAALAAYEGAIQESKHWLAQTQTEEPAVAEEN